LASGEASGATGRGANAKAEGVSPINSEPGHAQPGSFASSASLVRKAWGAGLFGELAGFTLVVVEVHGFTGDERR
jgi:hypothetical protein